MSFFFFLLRTNYYFLRGTCVLLLLWHNLSTKMGYDDVRAVVYGMTRSPIDLSSNTHETTTNYTFRVLQPSSTRNSEMIQYQRGRKRSLFLGNVMCWVFFFIKIRYFLLFFFHRSCRLSYTLRILKTDLNRHQDWSIFAILPIKHFHLSDYEFHRSKYFQ